VNALLQVYKNYYPDIIVADVGTFRAGLFSVRFVIVEQEQKLTKNQHPNPEWMQQVLSIQEAHAARAANEPQKSSFKVVRQVNGKRRKADRGVVIPEVHTFGATEVSRRFSARMNTHFGRNRWPWKMYRMWTTLCES
jgi:centromere protein I